MRWLPGQVLSPSGHWVEMAPKWLGGKRSLDSWACPIGQLALMLAAGAAGSFFGVGYLGERYGGLRAILVFSTAQALFLLALAFVEDLTALYLAGILFGLGYGGILPCYPVIVREYLPPAEAGRRTGVVILFAGGGMALGSWIGGAAFDQTGSYRAAFLLGVAFNLANLLMIGSLILRTGPNPRRAKA